MQYGVIFFLHHTIMTNCRFYLQAHLNRMLWRSLVVSAISTVGLFTGLVPDLSSSSILVFSTRAYAQEFSQTEVTNYAKAVLEAEPVRAAALGEIKQSISGGAVPQIVCYKPESLDNLPENARTIAKNYCKQYEDIVSKYFTSFEEFNSITKNVQNDPNLKKRIQDEMLRLQGNP